jgi:hypothetical protein
VDSNHIYSGIVACSKEKNLGLRKVMLVALDNINAEHKFGEVCDTDRFRIASLMALTWQAGRRYGQAESIEDIT